MASTGRARDLDVRDLRVLVTGGGGGIGRVIAETLTAAGAHVHITDVHENTINEAISAIPGLTGTLGDAADARDADRTLQDVVARFEGLDVLVNNVGIAGPTGNVETYSDDEVGQTIDVNIKSHFYFLNRCVPLLKASGNNPSVLAVSSVAGRLGYGYRSPYAATKWAIVGMIKSLAAELGPAGVRANAILPGAVQGPRMDKVMADRAEALGVSFEEMKQSNLNKISLRRMVDAGDVADLALFLTSSMARNISGQAISVDGNTEYL